jgi:hypothetical protein
MARPKPARTTKKARGFLKAPFPAFGGKRTVADLIWSRLGDVDNFIKLPQP